jgi:hypothetical protein
MNMNTTNMMKNVKMFRADRFNQSNLSHSLQKNVFNNRSMKNTILTTTKNDVNVATELISGKFKHQNSSTFNENHIFTPMKKSNLFVKYVAMLALIIGSSFGVFGQGTATVSNNITGQTTNLTFTSTHSNNIPLGKLLFAMGGYGLTTTNYPVIPSGNLVLKINGVTQNYANIATKSMLSAAAPNQSSLMTEISMPSGYVSQSGDVIEVQLNNMLVNPAPQQGYLFLVYFEESNNNNIHIHSGSYNIYGPPTITSFSPTSLYVGQTATITGTEFNGATSVKFNGVNATSFSVVSNTSITAVAPTGLSAGTISVTTPYGTANSSAYTVISTPPLSLKITSISPMAAAVGSTVTINGTGFNTTAANNVVYFGGVKCIPSAATSTSLTVTVPTGAMNGKIRVINLADAIQVCSTTDFNVSYSTPITATPLLVQKGTFALSSAITLSSNQVTVASMNIAVADFNEDGKCDILLPANTGGANLFLNTSSGANSYSFASPTILSGDGTSDYTMVSTGDFDNDGRIDAIIGANGNVRIFLNKIVNGNLTFVSNQFSFSGNDRLRIGDINNDGKLDVLGAGYFTSTVIGLLNTSTTSLSFSASQTIATGLTYSRSFAIGDMNNDGYLDLMLARDGSVASPDATKIFINNGLNGIVSFNAYDATNFSGTADAYAYTLDVNGDGNNDLLMGRGNYNNMFIYQNSFNGSSFAGSNLSTYTWMQPQWSGPTTRNNSFGDLNGDGKVDLVQGGSTNSYIFLNTTNPLGSSYTYNTLVKTISNPIITAVADFDLNGISDVFYLDPSLGNGSFHELSTVDITVTNTGTAFYSCPSGYDTQVQTATINATGLTSDLIVNAPNGYEVSLSQTSGFGSSVTIAFGTGTLSNSLVYYRSTASNTTGLGGSFTFVSNSATLYSMAVTSTVVPAPQMSQFGTQLAFDGTDDKVSIASTTELTLPNTFTIEAWVYVDPSLSSSIGSLRLGVASKNVWISSGGATSTNGLGYGLDIEYGKPRLVIGKHDGAWGGAQSATNIVTGAWVHLAGTYDGTNVKLYINGTLNASSTSSNFWNNGADLTIGSWPGESKFFKGKIDDVRIWNVTRTQSEIAAAKDAQLTGSESGLLAYYKFNQGSPNGTNTSISSITDAVAPASNGTWAPFAKTGTTSNIVGIGISGPTTATVTNTNTYTHSNTVSGWSVSNPSLASINSSGVLTVLGTGSLNVLADYTSNNCTYQSSYAINTIYTTVSSTPNALSGFAACAGAASTSQTISVDGVGLSSDITVTAPTGFEVSLSSGSGYSSSVTLTQSGGVVNATTIYVRQSATATGTPSGNITISSTGAADALVALSGTVNPIPTVAINDPAAVCTPATVDLTASAVTVGSTSGLTFTYWTNSGATTALASPSAVTASGTYYIKGTTSAGCSSIQPVNVTVNAPITAVTAAVNQQPCGSTASGSATVTLTGGIATNYAWTKGGVSYNATPSNAPTNLTAGTYVVAVTDACGNTVNSNSITITNVASLSISNVSQTGTILCNGATTGAITGTITGGGTAARILTVTNQTTNQAYSSQTPTGGSAATGYTYTVANLPAGTYTVVASSSVSSCTATASNVTISQPAVLVPVGTPTAACYGLSNGSIAASATGGTAPYTYSIDGTNFQSSTTFTSLSAGSYTLSVKDANNCSATSSVTVTQPSTALSVSVATQTNVNCFGQSTGAITVAGLGGTGTYTYSKNGTTFQAGTTFASLAAGTYTITIKDASNCTATTTVTITQPAAALALSTTGTNIACNAATTGAISSTVTGGTSPYSYAWSNSATTANLSSLAAGTYTLTVTDNNGCTASSTKTITQPTALSASISTQTNVLCFGGTNGAATVSTTGGTPGYTYAWTGGGNTSSISGKAAGTYTVTVTDQNNCTTTATATITEPSAALAASISASTNVLCRGNNTGSATVTVTGGTSAYTYSWDTTPAQTSATASNLVAGTYTVTVTDANNCTTTATVSITEPAAALSATISSPTNVLCNGAATGAATVVAAGGTSPYTYSWTNSATTDAISSLAAGPYTATVTDANSCTATATVTITQPTALTGSTTFTNACFNTNNGTITVTATGGTGTLSYSIDNGTTYVSSGAFTALAAGTYQVKVKDANNCVLDLGSITIQAPSAALTGTTSITNVTCNGLSTGAIDLTPAGGQTPYTFAWTGPNSYTATTEDLTSSPAGSYSVTITDTYNCTTTVNASITEPSAITITKTVTDVACFGASTGSITAAVTGGTSGYTYSWSGPNSYTSTTLTPQSNLVAGTYTLTVTDANFCTATSTATVAQPSAALAIANSVTNVACYGLSTGAITPTVTGGTAPYSYSWNTNPVQTTANLTGLADGNYTLTVTDAHACTQNSIVAITQPAAALSITTAVTTLPSCHAASDAVVTTTVTGGTSPYTYLWNTGLTTANINNATAHWTYNLTVTDANGCTQIASQYVPAVQILLSLIHI